MDVTLGGAFIGGVLSFLSPCVLPLVPPYLCYIAGLSYDELVADGHSVRRGHILASAAVFVLGFGLVFMAFGATASVFGRIAAEHARTLSVIAGALIILFGLHFLGLFRIGLLFRQIRLDVGAGKTGIMGAFLMGLAFAFGWTPCVGPILAAVLFMAGGEETVSGGMGLLAAYAAGVGVPFILAAAFTGQFVELLKRHRRYLGFIEKASGVLLVVTGVLFMTGGMADIAFWLLEVAPGLGRIG